MADQDKVNSETSAAPSMEPVIILGHNPQSGEFGLILNGCNWVEAIMFLEKAKQIALGQINPSKTKRIVSPATGVPRLHKIH